MTMTPGLRKFALSVHITSSVGWIGAVVAYLALAVVTRTSQDAQVVRSVFLALDLITRFVLVPLALTSLLTGLVMSLGTKWGLFKHYWVLIPLVLTIFATVVLLTRLEPISLLAGIAAEADSADLLALEADLLHPVGGLLVLLVIQVMNVYKPRGLTPYGWRNQQEQRTVRQPVDAAT